MPPPGPRRRSIREEPGYIDSVKSIEPDVERFDEIARAAVDRIERDAENCPEVSAEPLMAGHGRLRVSQAVGPEDPDVPTIQIFFTIQETGEEQCSLWRVRRVSPDEG